MARILAIADEVEDRAYAGAFEKEKPDLIVSCGDLPFDYLEYLVTTLGRPLVYVPGNHDPNVSLRTNAFDFQQLHAAPFNEPPGPCGCMNVDGRIVEVAGLRIAGLGGSARYSQGPNQYTESQMKWRSRTLQTKARLHSLKDGRLVDVLITHAPPLGVGDDTDPPHRGFASFHGLVRRLRPKVLIHGHIHPYGQTMSDKQLDRTSVLNAVGWRVVEVNP